MLESLAHLQLESIMCMIYIDPQGLIARYGLWYYKASTPAPKYALIPNTVAPAINASEPARLTSGRAVHPLKFNMQDRGGPLAPASSMAWISSVVRTGEMEKNLVFSNCE
jgi:hypothetical protein